MRPLSKVQPGEGLIATLMLVSVFAILTSYYVMKTAREGLILAGGTLGLRGDELKTYATGAMAIVLVGVVPAYGFLANRVRRIRLINISYAIVIVSLLAFFVVGRAGLAIGLPFFIWLGLVSVFLVAQFWSYANDLYTEEQGKRLFAIIALGGSIGAMLGPRVAKLADTFTLLPIAAGILILCVVILNVVEHLHRRAPAARTHADEPVSGAGGFSLVLHDGYLLLMATMLLVLNLINTTGEYILSNAVRESALAATSDPAAQRELIKAFYADFFSWVNLISFLLQAFLVSRIIEKLGVRRALFVMPILVFGAYGAIGLFGGLALIRAAKLIDNSLDYSLQNTIRQSLFLPTTRAVKFKAKAAIDTFFMRAGDLLSALLVGFGLHQLGMTVRQLAFANLVLVAGWLAITVGIARRHRALSKLTDTPADTPTPTRPRKLAIATATACLFAVPARAEEPPPEAPRTAADVDGAPRPGEESGRIDDPDPGPSTAVVAGRAALWVPRLALELAFAPVRAGIYATEKYDVVDRLYELFYDDTHTFGIHPTADIHTDFGATFGARAVHRNLFGAREHVSLRAAFGGRYRELVKASLRSGHRLDPIEVELVGEIDRRPEEPFYGIGNLDAGSIEMPIDPRTAPVAIETRYRQQLARAATRVGLRVAPHLHLQAAGSLTDLDFAPSEDGPPIDEVYMIEGMIGYDGLLLGYTELELRWDSRRAQAPWDPPAIHSRGTFAAAFAGRSTNVRDGGGFWRGGVDLQRYWRLADGPRTLITRLYGEAVGGPDAIPFVELPMLGGKTLLRGYPTDRFRDRIAALGSVEYQWDLARRLSASAFVDAGRVYESARDVELDGMRLGYGIGLQGHTSHAFLVRASIASSIDGGVFLHFSFDPVFELRPRTERR